LKNSNDDLTKRAPLLLDSRLFFREQIDKSKKRNNNNIFSDNYESPNYIINTSTNEDLKSIDSEKERESNSNNSIFDKFKNKNNPINRANENIDFKEKNNLKDNGSETKDFNHKLSNIFKNNKNDNISNISNRSSRIDKIDNYLKKDKPSKTFDFYLYNENKNIPNDLIKKKQKYKNKNNFYRTKTANIKNNNLRFYSNDKNEYKRQKKLNDAMNILLGNYSQSIPLINNNMLKLKNKSFQNNFIPNKGNRSIKLKLNNHKNNDFNFNFKAKSDRQINNMKYYKKNNMQSFMNNFEIRKKLRTSNKYPEPEDIDDYLINMKDEL